MLAEEVLRDLQVDAGAVAGLAVGVDRTAVPHRLQRLDAGDHHIAPRRSVERGDEADAAGVMLLRRVVEALAAELCGIALPGRDDFFPGCGRGAVALPRGSLLRHRPVLPSGLIRPPPRPMPPR